MTETHAPVTDMARERSDGYLETIEELERSHQGLLDALRDILPLARTGFSALPRSEQTREQQAVLRAADNATRDAQPRETYNDSDRCDECGDTPALIGAPDGAQICQGGFDAGVH